MTAAGHDCREAGGRQTGASRAAGRPPRISRSASLSAACPRCGAAAHTPCQGRRGDRRAPHVERYEAAASALSSSTRSWTSAAVAT